MGSFAERLNAVQEKLLSPSFLHSTGLGNEISFYIFDYPPQEELKVRMYLASLSENIARQAPTIRVMQINLFSLIIKYLHERKIFTSAISMQKKQGNESLLKALKAPLNETKIADYFTQKVEAEQPDIIIVSGVGECYPLLRSHSLLNNLHSRIDKKPLVLFYPGEYSRQSLRLFSCLPENNYYRAFQLIA